jgi:hypothetical protein
MKSRRHRRMVAVHAPIHMPLSHRLCRCIKHVRKGVTPQRRSPFVYVPFSPPEKKHSNDFIANPLHDLLHRIGADDTVLIR